MNWNERLVYWVLILVMIILLRECKTKVTEVKTDVVTTVKLDTVFVHDTMTVKSYIPILTKEQKPAQVQYVPYYADYSFIDSTNDYKTVRYYTDSQRLSNGYIKIKDTVSENRIKGRSIEPFITFPVITKTVTVTDYERPLSQLYLGIGAYGNKNVPINAAGLSLLFKTRRNRMYEAGAMVDVNKNIWYYGSLKFKIK